MALTPEQLKVWNSTKTRRPGPSGDQTLDQAWAFAIWDFQQVCAFEGVEVPSDGDVAEALGQEQNGHI